MDMCPACGYIPAPRMYVIMDGARGEMHDGEEATESSLLKLGAGASIAGSVSGEAEEPEVCIRFEDEEDDVFIYFVDVDVAPTHPSFFWKSFLSSAQNCT